MGYFITEPSRVEPTNIANYSRMLDNEVYMSNDGKISITPRYFWTDGYSGPKLIRTLIKNKNLDLRPAHGHDLFCRFHQRLFVDLTLYQLRYKGYIHEYNDKIICEDIPDKYLHAEIINKKTANDLMKEMMLACNFSISQTSLIRLGICFNFNWRNTGKRDIMTYDIYNEDIGLVNGF